MMRSYPRLKFQIYAFDKSFDLVHAPIGWDESKFTEGVEDEYNVLQNFFSTELKFVFEGADILRLVAYQTGPDAKARLKISEFNYDSRAYDQIVFADLDFKKYVSTKEGVSIAVNESGVKESIKAYQDTEFSIDVDASNNAIDVNIGGIGVNGYSNFFGGTVGTVRGVILTPILEIGDNTTTTDIVIPNVQVQQSGVGTESEAQASVDGYFLEPELAGFNIRISGTFTIQLRAFLGSDSNNATLGNLNIKTYVRIYDGVSSYYTIKNMVLMTNPYGDTDQFTYSFDLNIPSTIGNKLQFQVYKSNALISCILSVVDFKIEYTTYTTDYFGKALRGIDLYKALCKKMNPNVIVNPISDLLDNTEWNRLVFMSGDNIRGLTGSKIQTTFKKFFNSVNARLLIGLKVSETTISLDYLTKFYNQYVQICDIGEVKDLKIEFLNDYFFSQITVGYEDQEYQEVDGKDEFNTTETWINPDTTSILKKEILSSYRADPRGVDQLLINYRADPTKDNKGDTEVFMFKIQENPEDGVYKVESVEAYKEVGGVSSLGRSYNIDLSPRQMLKGNGAALAVPFSLKKSGVINFESSKKNSNLYTVDFNDKLTREKDPINYIDMPAPLFLPVKCTATVALSNAKYKELQANRHLNGYVKFSYIGKVYKGFLVTSTFELIKRGQQDFVFYLTSDNDLNKK